MRIVLLLSLMVIGLANNCFAEDEKLIGDWYMEGVEHGAHAQFIIHNQADGTFSKEIRDTTDCARPLGWKESGTWSAELNTYREVTKKVGDGPVDSSLPTYNDSFTVQRTDATHIFMYDPKTGITWQAERVPAGFQMPLANGCSV
jgi:hypothetical protein